MKKPAPNNTSEDGDAPQRDPAQPSMFATYQRHLAALKRHVMRITHAENDVEDVVQEAFIRAYQAEAGGHVQQPKSYLFRVAKNVAINQIRQKIARPTDYLEDSSPENVLVEEWSLEDEVLAQERLSIHCAAVAALPPRRRKVYLLRKVYGMSHKEIAANLGITTSTVEAHLAKAYKQCHEYVAERTQTGEYQRGATAGFGPGRLGSQRDTQESDNG